MPSALSARRAGQVLLQLRGESMKKKAEKELVKQIQDAFDRGYEVGYDAGFDDGFVEGQEVSESGDNGN